MEAMEAMKSMETLKEPLQQHADKVIDARNMEPPEPFVRTMEALDEIGPGQRVLLIVGRDPLPLYRALELNRVACQTQYNDDGTVEVLMWHKPSP
jgi:TusA-related sulfurtransferase